MLQYEKPEDVYMQLLFFIHDGVLLIEPQLAAVTSPMTVGRSLRSGI